ncbi:unnamed protein product [Cuscuta europaea]|uniref:HTH myb-type domain-containing protein n=1 Tax=Cuscuta europaea TaxID=41803 RepID=A0A9P0YK60_CUSEU|nr:unnamed protein product [Cuscuta europaea]
MIEEDSNWFVKWEEQLPSPDELMPISQTLISPHLAIAFDIRNAPNSCSSHLPPPPPPPLSTTPSSQPNSSAEFDSADLGGGGDEPARTLKRPRLVWTPQLHKRFVDAVAHLGIKNAVPKTIMQLMSVDGLTRENVASHLQKYRLYLKRMQNLSNGGSTSTAGVDSATDHLFASSPVPAHFLNPAVRHNPDPFIPFATMQHQIAAAAGAAGNHHPQLHRQYGYFGSPPNGQFERPFHLSHHHRVNNNNNSSIGSVLPRSYMEPAAAGGGGRKVLTLFPTGDD